MKLTIPRLVQLLLSVALLSFALGVITGYYIKSRDKKEVKIPVESVKTTQISGEKITVKPMSVTGNTLTFQTEAQGAGIAQTEIDKQIIPEAANWMNKDYTAGLQLGLINVNNQFELLVDASLYRRWNSFSVGGALAISESTWAIKAGVLYMF